ncbi:phosphatidylethanolamine-binding protein homolog F40A3.3-like isoform X2 [Sipha flava]|nr:phosphatidylethanolamine-binding protein homolog F40A3.3-like isoform X2 [Sipha flava]
MILNFMQYGIQPEIIPFCPLDRLKVVFADRSQAHGGNDLSYNNISYVPDINYNALTERLYTLVYIDAGVTQRIVHNSSQFIQWVVVNIPENDVGLGETVLPFVESPPKNITIKGYQAMSRYVILAYLQFYYLEKDQIKEFKSYIQDRSGFSIADILFEYNMTIPQFGNFFLAKPRDSHKKKKTVIHKYSWNDMKQKNKSWKHRSVKSGSIKLNSEGRNSSESNSAESKSEGQSSSKSSSAESNLEGIDSSMLNSSEQVKGELTYDEPNECDSRY